MIVLDDADARALLTVAAERIVDDGRVNERFALNHIAATPPVLQATILSCTVAMEHGAVTVRVPAGDLRILAPIADLIADLINAEVGENVGFVMTC